MDFFARQDATRRSSRWLVVLFGLAFLAVALATATVVAIALNLFDGNGGGIRTSGAQLPSAVTVVAGVAAVTMGLMIIASLFRAATLSRGGGHVAAMMGGTRIRGDDPDPLHRRLINVVEEMAIASGLPVPEIYVLEDEAGINAFAAGRSQEDAAIAVTRGSLEHLTRAELSGVVAHEFSHILNGDMRLNLRLIGFSFGILVLSLLGRWLLHSARFTRRSRGGGVAAVLLIGIGMTVIGAIGVLLSRLIKAAVSRRRESLADASAVQFTREPLALAGALKKIGGYTPYLTAVDAEEVSHMLFGQASASFRGWFATHPPLTERIRALDPGFDERDYAPAPEQLPPAAEDEPPRLAAGLAAAPALDTVTAGAAGRIETAETGATLRSAIPGPLLAAAHDPEQSLLLVVAIAAEVDTAGAAGALLEAQLGRERADRCKELGRLLGELDRRLWLPLVELTVPALKRRPQPQIEFLFDLLGKLAVADQQRSLFEYALAQLLRAYLGRAAAVQRGPRPTPADAWLTLLATVAVLGHADADAARAALRAALPELPSRVQARAEERLQRVLDDPDPGHLDTALDRLAELDGKLRRRVLRSLERTIRHDGDVGIEEAELFRVIAASMGCPIPPPAAVG